MTIRQIAVLDANNALQVISTIDALLVQETTITPSNVAISATANNLLVANTSRIRVVITNPLSVTLYVRKALANTSPATTSPGGYDFTIPSLGTFISDPFEYSGAYNAVASSNGFINVSESI